MAEAGGKVYNDRSSGGAGAEGHALEDTIRQSVARGLEPGELRRYEVRCPDCKLGGFLFEVRNGIVEGAVEIYRKCPECKRRLRVQVRPGEVSEPN